MQRKIMMDFIVTDKYIIGDSVMNIHIRKWFSVLVTAYCPALPDVFFVHAIGQLFIYEPTN